MSGAGQAGLAAELPEPTVVRAAFSGALLQPRGARKKRACARTPHTPPTACSPATPHTTPLVAPPGKTYMSSSTDKGATWTRPSASYLPNPNSPFSTVTIDGQVGAWGAESCSGAPSRSQARCAAPKPQCAMGLKLQERCALQASGVQPRPLPPSLPRRCCACSTTARRSVRPWRWRCL